MAVGTDSALLNLPCSIETQIPVDKDHSSMTKFNSTQDRTYRSVLSHLWGVLDDGILWNAGYDPQDIASATDALRSAVAGGDFWLVRQLLARGGDPNFLSDTGNTPLLCMAMEIPGSAEMVRLLLDHGANVRATEGGSDFSHSTVGRSRTAPCNPTSPHQPHGDRCIANV
jgi:hypothetical protein